jgi:hypothetical protein
MSPIESEQTSADKRRAMLAKSLFWLIALHIIWGVSRIPHAVIGKRWRDIAAYHHEGEAAWRLQKGHLDGAQAIHHLREVTAEESIIPISGSTKGALEYAAALLWPRLCCWADQLPAKDQFYAGRPIAPYLLTGDRTTLRVEPR